MSTKENLIKIYEYALNQEQTGMSFFQTSLDRMGIGAAVSAFKRLVEEEEKHILFISCIIDNLKAGADIDIAKVQEFVMEGRENSRPFSRLAQNASLARIILSLSLYVRRKLGYLCSQVHTLFPLDTGIRILGFQVRCQMLLSMFQVHNPSLF